jgi:transcriptional regulator with XRE-family HTH domain
MARAPAPARRGAQTPQRIGEDVGPQLRARREEKNLSLRELARRLEISPSALSQIETGKSRPSVSTLYAIVSELGMSLDQLFGGVGAAGGAAAAPTGKESRSPRRGVRTSPEVSADRERVQRAVTRSAIPLESGVRWERLTANVDPEADFLWVVYEPGGSSSQADGFIRHAGREYGIVLSGTLEVTVGFDTYELGPGDSITFDSTTPHRLRNTGAEPVEGVWVVVGRGGDVRAHGLEGAAPDESG